MEMMHGHIQLLKAIHGFAMVAIFLLAAALALLRRSRVKGMGLVCAGLFLLAFAWVFEALTYVLPPADSFEGGMVHIAGYMGGVALGAPLILLGLLLLSVRGKRKRGIPRAEARG